MASQTAAKPDRFTGLPPGVDVGPLGRRLAAHLVDGVVPAVCVAVVLGTGGPGAQATDVVAVVLLVVWALVVWWMFATRAAGPGMRLMKLQLVGFSDGRPIGWGRFLVRALVLGLLSATGIGLLLLLFFLLRHPRYQGWHDLAAGSVVIKERMLAPRGPRPAGPAAAVASGAGAPRPLTPPAGGPGVDPVAGALLATALLLAPRGVEVGMAPVAPAAVAAGPVRATAEPVEPGKRTERIAPPVRRGAAPPPAPRRWTVVLDDGREVPVGGLVLLGRNPQPRPGEETAELVKVADETRTVSKSHLALDVDDDGLFVVDRGSTNGSTVTTTDGLTTPCEPGRPVHVTEGSVVSIGDHWLTVRQD
ncbi:MAG: hypothetical protein AVDCRST_MAG48-1247 [uncultured Friedmanniella sp.]|uniref:FHA domain-containing protein n=1 Tax=uncultured Friedmanniella sp. TaxID=335381 RepID=A0A6J4KAU6_9ACTN|nr:MAG: hypothetical protein AVDCRST_MAG48-1247 [uncultured Friedmanniella sp.]